MIKIKKIFVILVLIFIDLFRLLGKMFLFKGNIENFFFILFWMIEFLFIDIGSKVMMG